MQDFATAKKFDKSFFDYDGGLKQDVNDVD